MGIIDDATKRHKQKRKAARTIWWTNHPRTLRTIRAGRWVGRKISGRSTPTGTIMTNASAAAPAKTRNRKTKTTPGQQHCHACKQWVPPSDTAHAMVCAGNVNKLGAKMPTKKTPPKKKQFQAKPKKPATNQNGNITMSSKHKHMRAAATTSAIGGHGLNMANAIADTEIKTITNVDDFIRDIAIALEIISGAIGDQSHHLLGHGLDTKVLITILQLANAVGDSSTAAQDATSAITSYYSNQLEQEATTGSVFFGAP